MKSYIQKMRAKIGKRSFIHPGARIIIENDKNEILFIKRVDNGKIGIPAGAIEEEETIEECIRREVKEETGLILRSLEMIGISSKPERETAKYPNGDTIQYFTIEFYSNSWEGNLEINDKSEVKKAEFMPLDTIKKLPENERHTFESLKYYQKTGKANLS